METQPALIQMQWMQPYGSVSQNEEAGSEDKR